jgi:hypothetical protein
MTQTKVSPPHSYLSAIRDLTSSDAGEVLRKKRDQQAALADALRHQIEEKEQQSRAPSGLGLPDADLSTTVCIAPEPRRSPPKPPRKQLFLKADLSHFDRFAKCDGGTRPPIAISTESPLAASNVPTPPPGFSLRGLAGVEPARKPEVKARPPAELRAKSTLASIPERSGATKLGAQSELIYPDGHRSPLQSPRAESSCVP